MAEAASCLASVLQAPSRPSRVLGAAGQAGALRGAQGPLGLPEVPKPLTPDPCEGSALAAGAN